MARMDNVAITARIMPIALLAPPFARTALLELRTLLGGPASRAAFKAHAGVKGGVRHGAAGERSGDARRTWWRTWSILLISVSGSIPPPRNTLFSPIGR